MKTKEVEIGEQKFKIGSLTVDQYEAFIGDGVKLSGKEFIRNHMVPIVAAAMQNAECGNGKWFNDGKTFTFPGDGQLTNWAPGVVSSTLDFAELEALYAEVIALSGLKSSGAKAGEAPAATIQ